MVLVQEQAKDVVLPDAKERFVGKICRQREESTVAGEGPVGDQPVDVGVEVHELAERLAGQDTTGPGVVADQGAVGLEDRLSGQAWELLKQVAVIAEEDA